MKTLLLSIICLVVISCKPTSPDSKVQIAIESLERQIIGYKVQLQTDSSFFEKYLKLVDNPTTSLDARIYFLKKMQQSKTREIELREKILNCEVEIAKLKSKI